METVSVELTLNEIIHLLTSISVEKQMLLESDLEEGFKKERIEQTNDLIKKFSNVIDSTFLSIN